MNEALWSSLENAHPGETCIIIGNGPSLNDIPVSFLRQYPSFGTNRIYLFHAFVPTYYVCVNPLVCEQYAHEIAALSCDAKFIAGSFAPQIKGALPLHSVIVPTFSRRPNIYIYEGYTVTFVAMQIAFWMGFQKVLLVGVDHSYKFDGKPNEEKVMGDSDPNHFSETYFTNAKWNNPDLKMSENSYQLAQTVFMFHGREIVNCSTKTELNVFPKQNWRHYANLSS